MGLVHQGTRDQAHCHLQVHRADDAAMGPLGGVSGGPGHGGEIPLHARRHHAAKVHPRGPPVVNTFLFKIKAVRLNIQLGAG